MQEIKQVSQEKEPGSMLSSINFEMYIQNKDLFKCSENNYANLACYSQKCKQSAFFCGNQSCKCQQKHLTCHYSMLKTVFKKMLKKQIQAPEKVKQSYNQVLQMIDKMIDQLSDLKFKLQLQKQYFGFQEKQIQLIELIKQNKVKNITGKLIFQVQQNLDKKINFDMMPLQRLQKEIQKKKKDFSSLCQEIYKTFSKKDKVCFDVFFHQSKILTEYQDQLLLSNWVKETVKQSKKLKQKLLFRASQHGFKAAQFHNHCNQKAKTVIIVKNDKDKIFGGYAHQAWDKQENYVKDESQTSFLFSLSLKQKINCNQGQYSIHGGNQYGPVFGNGNDMYIHDTANNNTSSFFQPFTSYDLSKHNKNYSKNQQTFNLLLGENSRYFKVNEYEVYQIYEIQ